MREGAFETVVGAAVAFVTGLFLWYMIAATDQGTSNERYFLTARFNNIGGIATGSDVRLAGVKVGVVQSIEADFDRAEAVVMLSVDKNLTLADDADARVTTDGLLGNAYISIQQGGGFDEIAKDGSGEIIYTRGSVDLLTLAAELMSGSDSSSE